MMSMSARGNTPHQQKPTTSDQEETPDIRTESSTFQHQQSKRNTSKRTKEGDDSFELEQRMVNLSNQYFNSNIIRQELSETPSRSAANVTNTVTKRPC
jgi:hypothetical protein